MTCVWKTRDASVERRAINIPKTSDDRLFAVGLGQLSLVEYALCPLEMKRGQFTVTFERGPTLNSKADREPSATESPLVEGLLGLGFDLPAASSLVRRYPRKLVALWTDITQAAIERFGRQHFRKSPMAYFVDSLSKAAQGTRTPPDWWHDIRKAEQNSDEPTSESREVFTKLLDEVFGPERRDTKAKCGLVRAGDLLKAAF